MTISLTKEQFAERLEKRFSILKLAFEKDLEEYKTAVHPIKTDSGELTVELTEVMRKLIAIEIKRVVDLIYMDDLDCFLFPCTTFLIL